MYKLYFGGYNKKGIPPLTLIEESNKRFLINNIQKLLDILPYGLDLYIETPKGKIYGWYKDLKTYTNDELKGILNEM